MRETTQGPEEYLASLVTVADGASLVTELDGAALYRVADEHFVVFSCNDDEHTHRGGVLLPRILPKAWVMFHEAVNHEDGFYVRHYGPDLEVPDDAE